jgi:DNA polymerase III subunit alpha
MPKFSHLHVHTQFSLLDGAAPIKKLYEKSINEDMPALAITDHGNMFGAFQFVAEAYKHKNSDGSLKVKPIVGCEFYLVEDRHKKTFTKEKRDKRFHQLMLAKNEIGYKNLTKLCSLGYIEGMYSKYPRIDKELVEKYHEGLIATTCCLGASVPRTIVSKGEETGEQEFLWWLNLFGEDYYIEIQRHGIPEQEVVNEVLLRFAAKHNVPIIASNDSHYVDQADANAHDILLCINTGEKQSTPTLKEFSDDSMMGKGKRFAFYNDQFFFKTPAQMLELFSDIPQAIDNTNLIVDKITPLNLERDIMLPVYEIPKKFKSQDAYLEYLTYEGARKRYGEILPEIEERLKFELHTIFTMGFAGYFLIVSDFIKAGRDMGVFIGPGRGSAAGSAVAYCIGITNIDPIKYNLLFERFLNPDRKSMPDIDTDFDDEGRQKVIDYVVNKYGRNQVAQIITYGSMAAKLSIKDVARVLDLPLTEAGKLAKLVPDRPGITLKRLLHAPLKGENSLDSDEGLGGDEIDNVKKLRKIYGGDDLPGRTMKEAEKLEGSVRNTGIHAAGIIIAPQDLTDLMPVATAKDSDLLVTQYGGKIIENAGVIKMDFLGLKTLTIIKTALRLIRENHDVDIDIEDISLTDAKTLELYQKGETNATFQFESAGMQKYLKDLKPDKFEDLIAMNALYRPGPLAYIPNFIERKHDSSKIKYDLPEMEEYLQETHGITVYQEQVMLLSQKLAGFTKGDADTLRKAMGKKQLAVLNKLKSKFMSGCAERGHDEKICKKIWNDWEAFASYAFNKSHSTCYAFVAFQTAYLKAHYPAEYMSAVLTHNLNNIDKVTFFMDECRRMGMKVLGPDINESQYTFSVNNAGQIRFGLGAVKGVGEGAVDAVVEEKKEGGIYTGLPDLVARVSLRNVNKRSLESLILAGAFDFDDNFHRAQWLAKGEGEVSTNLEKAMRYGNTLQDTKNSAQVSMFGDDSQVEMPQPKFVGAEPWSNLEKLKREKEVVGVYISGHPLDMYALELEHFCNISIAGLTDLAPLKGKELSFAGIVTSAVHRMTKTGKPFGIFSIEDYKGTVEIALFSDDYIKYKNFLEAEMLLYINAVIQPRFRDDGNLEIKIQGMKLLSDVGNQKTRSVTLKLDIDMINKSNLHTLNNLLSDHPGKLPVKFAVKDRLEELKVEMKARKLKVGFSKELFEEITVKTGATYQINT